MTDTPIWYHGTSRPFDAGATLLPGREVGRDNYPDVHDLHTRAVHVTTSLPMAVVFAMSALIDDPEPDASVCVYEVRPVGQVMQDPGGQAGEDHVCLRAVVVREVDPSEMSGAA